MVYIHVGIMTRNELIAKKQELKAQAEVLERKIMAIDEVLSLFPDIQIAEPAAISAPGSYADMTVADGVRAYLRQRPDVGQSVKDITVALQKGGIKTVARDFKNVVSLTLLRLEKQREIVSSKKAGRRLFIWPSEPAEDGYRNGS